MTDYDACRFWRDVVIRRAKGGTARRGAMLVLFVILCAPAGAHAEMTFSNVYFYGARYTRDEGTGYTGGAYGSLDWGLKGDTKGTHVGLISEIQIGLGYVPGTLIGVDLIADILGIGGRLDITKDFQLGVFYEPAELYATPIGGYIGSKLMLKAAYWRIQLEAGRGGNGIVYGWLLPKDEDVLQIASLQYVDGGNRTFGVRYLRAPHGAGEFVGQGVMLFIGWSI